MGKIVLGHAIFERRAIFKGNLSDGVQYAANIGSDLVRDSLSYCNPNRFQRRCERRQGAFQAAMQRLSYRGVRR
jgi:hypothetical protein